jgi:uncharacterized SAM-binding protein YcdF (DUF218 family)
LPVSLVGLGAVLLVVAFGRAGSWVVVSDPLQKADAIVVFGGQLPFRAMEAAKIYRAGWAPELWLTQGDNPEERTLRRLDIGYIGEHGYSRRVVEKLGVPREAIYILEPAVNTTEEVKAVLERLRMVRGKRAILVSSKAHTRRIRVTWQALAGRELEAVVRYTTEDPYEPERWWANSRDALSVTREIGGIVNAWMGFPLSAARE